ncbi:MAG: phosphoenolpyruvate--protein phosphotransferase [Elusimicrobiota bacterium]
MDESPSSSAPLRLIAPLDGWLVPLDKVPDPVFAQRIVGDGVSIDPTSSVVLAPCAGVVVHIHSAGHALTLRTDSGLEVLVHVGVDAVQLKGEGFTPKVKAGDAVRTGQPMTEFDADLVGRKAKSLLTQLLVTNVEAAASISHASGSVKAGRDTALEVVLRGAAAREAVPQKAAVASSDAIVISNPTGLHARPASLVAHAAKRFHAAVQLRRGDSSANAKSAVSIMSLNVKQDDKVVVTAEGADARDAVAEVSRLLSGVFDSWEISPPPPPPPPAPPKPSDPRALAGICASGGLAIGAACQFRRTEMKIAETAEDPAAERANLEQALEKAKGELETLQTRFAADRDPGRAAIFGAHRELLEDPELLAIAQAALAKGASAAAAWRCAYRDYAGRLSRLNNDLLAGRAIDIRDVGMRVLRVLTGAAVEKREFPPDSILLAEDLTPSDTAGLDASKVLGVCTVGGGATSHVAILCRALGLPALAAADPRVLSLKDGSPLILDADKCLLLTEPKDAELAAARVTQAQARKRRETDLAGARQEAKTIDGCRIRVESNIGRIEDAAEAARMGAEGVGLCRTEFLFLERETAPSEDEQTAAYTAMAKAFPDGPVVVRTLDIGGDKELPYLPMAKEENPFLGERGIRLLLERPELLRPQFRAVLRAAKAGAKLKILFPMVANAAEFRAAKAILEEERRALDAPRVPAGVMIEVPSAAVLSESLAREAEFFSIGTNDLTQYTLAMDRGNPKLAGRLDALDPSVLFMIRAAVDGAVAHERSVGVCGAAAGDPQAIPLLIGLGVSELSVSPPAVPAVKAEIRRLKSASCRELAIQALGAASAAEVRAMVTRFQEAA